MAIQFAILNHLLISYLYISHNYSICCFTSFQDSDEFGGFADAVEGTEQGVEIGLAGIEGDGDRAGTEVADDVLDTLLKGNVLHNLVAATLAMNVAAEEHHLALRLLRLLLLRGLIVGCRARHCRQ